MRTPTNLFILLINSNRSNISIYKNINMGLFVASPNSIISNAIKERASKLKLKLAESGYIFLSN